MLYADLGVRRSEDEFLADARWVEDRTRELMAAGTPGAPAPASWSPRWRPRALPTALVTTTPRRIAAVVLAQIADDLGGDPFDLTVCGDEVPARKPDPAPYRQAMTELRVDPACAWCSRTRWPA